MKVLFFITAIAAVSTLSAQNMNAPWVKSLTPKPQINSSKQSMPHKFSGSESKWMQYAPIFKMANGSEVYAVPNSNMLCIVPDSSQHNYNKNMALVKACIANTTPNSALPPYNLPPPITEEQFKNLLEMQNKQQAKFKQKCPGCCGTFN